LTIEVDSELRLTRALSKLRDEQWDEVPALLDHGSFDQPGGRSSGLAFLVGCQPNAKVAGATVGAVESVLGLLRAHALAATGRTAEASATLKRAATLYSRPLLFLKMAALYAGPADDLIQQTARRAGRGFRIAILIALIAIVVGIGAGVLAS
jgi:hypothetical protein